MKRTLILATIVGTLAAPVALVDTNGVVRSVVSIETRDAWNMQHGYILQPTNKWQRGVTNYAVGSAVPGITKVVNGGTNYVTITNRTEAEISAEQAAIAEAAAIAMEAAMREEAKAAVTNRGALELRIRAADLVLLQRLNRIGSSNGVPTMSPVQFMNLVRGVIDDRSAD